MIQMIVDVKLVQSRLRVAWSKRVDENVRALNFLISLKIYFFFTYENYNLQLKQKFWSLFKDKFKYIKF